MADGTIRLPADSTGKFLDTTELVVGANTVERERLVITGDAAAELADVKSQTPSSSAYGLVVRQAMGDTGTVLGSIAVLSGATGNLVGYTLISTGIGGAAIDPRAASLTATSSQTFPTQLSTAPNQAYIDPRQVRALTSADVVSVSSGVVLAAGASSNTVGNVTVSNNVNVSLLTSPISVQTNAGAAANLPTQVFGGGSSGVLGTALSATGLTGAAIDPRQVTLVAATSGAFVSTRWSTQTTNGSTVIDTANEAVRVNIVAGSAAGATAALLQAQSTDGTWTSVGYAVPFTIPVGITTAHNSTTIIDPRAASLTASSSQTFPTQISTAPNGAYIDPRIVTPSSQWTVTVSPTTLSVAPTTQWTVSIQGTASSAVLGTVLSATGLTGAAIDPRQVTIVAGTSGAYISVLSATAQGAATIDPRQVTIVAGTSGAIIGATPMSSGDAFIMATTTVPSTDAMALVSRLTSSSSGQTIGNVTVSTGTVALYSSTGGAIAVSTDTLSTDAMGVAVRVAASASSNVIGTVHISTANSGLRGYLDSTSPNQLYFWTTGIAAAAAATMQSLNRTTNLSSGSSGTSFNVAAGRIFRIDHIEGSIRLSSGTDLYADFAIRAVTSTSGTTGSNFPVFYYRLASAVAASTNALAVGGGGANFGLTGLSIDLPSSASFGVSIVSNSTASQECTFSFGGKEYLI